MRLLAVTHPDQKNINSKSSNIKIYGQDVSFSMLNIEVDLDSRLDEDMVLVKKTAFSLNYRDKGICLNAFNQLVEDNEFDKYFTIGSEFSGIVINTGSAVTSLKVGDRVMPNHSYPYSGYKHVLPGVISNKCSSEYGIFHFSKLLKIPDLMTDDVAAAFSLGAQTAYSMIRKSNIEQGQIALVTAASSNTSLHLINALVIKGIEVHAITTQRNNVQFFKSLGVKEAYFYDTNMEFFYPDQDIAREKHLFDVVFDPLFDIYFTNALELMKTGARYLTCGRYDQFSAMDEDYDDTNEPSIKITQLMGYILHNNISLIGNCLGITQDLLNAFNDFEHNNLHVIVDSTFSDGDFKNFIERSFNAKDRLGKVIYKY